MATMVRGQQGLDIGLDGEPVHARIEHRLVLDDDDVGSVAAARRDGRQQRQRLLGDVAEREPAELPPGARNIWQEPAAPMSREAAKAEKKHRGSAAMRWSDFVPPLDR